MPTLADLPTSKFQALTRLVGNTPLVTIHFRLEGKHRVLYAKSEYLNLTGSIKDRMAVRILQQAYTDGKISPGDTIAEATSGNTGISFAAIGRMLGHPVKIFMPDWMSQERVHLIRSYGAEVVSVSKDEGGFLGSIRRCEELVVTIFCDNNKKYLSTALMDEEAPAAGVSLAGLELLGIGTVGRVCEFCH
jgi:cysteine synthase A